MVTNEIKLKIGKESDLYTPFDPDQKLLSEEVKEYLSRNYVNMHRLKRESFIIHIFSDTPVNEARVKEALRLHCVQAKENVKHSLRLQTLKELALGLAGLVLLSLWLILSASRSGVLMEILSIMGSVAIWEMTGIALLGRPELHIVYRTYDRALKSKVVFDIIGNENNKAV